MFPTKTAACCGVNKNRQLFFGPPFRHRAGLRAELAETKKPCPECARKDEALRQCQDEMAAKGMNTAACDVGLAALSPAKPDVAIIGPDDELLPAPEPEAKGGAL